MNLMIRARKENEIISAQQKGGRNSYGF